MADIIICLIDAGLTGWFAIVELPIFLNQRHQWARYGLFVGLIMSVLLAVASDRLGLLFGLSTAFIMAYSFFAFYGTVSKRLFNGLLCMLFIWLAFLASSYLSQFLAMSIPGDSLTAAALSGLCYATVLALLFAIIKRVSDGGCFYDRCDWQALTIIVAMCILTLLSIIQIPTASEQIFVYRFFLFLLFAADTVGFMLIFKRLDVAMKKTYQRKTIDFDCGLIFHVQEEIAKTYQADRRLRHDMINHLVAIEARIKSGDNKSALEYIATMKNAVEPPICVLTGNDTLDYLINTKCITISTRGIGFSHHIENSLLFVRPYDLTIIIGNLLDNAIEAQDMVTSQKHIALQITSRADIIQLVITNTFDESSIKEYDGHFMSTKKGSEPLGFGLTNVIDAARRYGGTCQFEHDHAFFISTITMPSGPHDDPSVNRIQH